MRLIDADELLQFVNDILKAGLITKNEAEIVLTLIDSSPIIKKEGFDYDPRLP